MIFPKKELTMPALKWESAHFAFSASPQGENAKSGVLYPAACLNFRAENGVLRGGFGAAVAAESALFAGYAPTAAYLLETAGAEHPVFYADGFLYVLSPQADGAGASVARLSETAFAAPPAAVRFVTADNAEKLIFFAPEGIYFYDGQTFSALQDAPAVRCGCTYYERLFAISAAVPYRIYFSAALDEEDWEHACRTAGYADLSPEFGEISGLFPCGKQMYALRERGLTVLRAEAENFEFSALPFPAAFGAVHENSAQIVGEHLLFLTADGLYAFDGSGAERCAAAWLGAEPPADAPDCRSGVWGAYYVLSYLTAAGARRTLFYDPAAEEGYLSDLDMSRPACAGADCYFFSGGAFLRLTRQSVFAGRPLQKVWQSGYIRPGTGTGRKRLRRVTLFGSGNFRLTIEGGHAREKRVYSLCLRDAGSVRPQLSDAGFFVRIESEDADCVLRGLDVEAAAAKEG